MDVFRAFPKAVNTTDWEIGRGKIGAVAGNSYEKLCDIDVIVDEGYNTSISDNTMPLGSDLLVYCRPEQLPTKRVRKLISDYILHDRAEGDYFAITDAGVGKNQHTGEVEHIELKLTAIEVYNV